jgi:hypothetical protein
MANPNSVFKVLKNRKERKMKTKRNLFKSLVCSLMMVGLLAVNAGAAQSDLSIYGDALYAHIATPSHPAASIEDTGRVDYSIYGAFVAELLHKDNLVHVYQAKTEAGDLSIYGEPVNRYIVGSGQELVNQLLRLAGR